MKRLTCDICGGIDLIKQDGVFVCQTCYTKYSVEEVKRMMSDEFDNSALSIRKESNTELNNLIILAERAFNESNYASAEKYYDDILRIDPNNWKANFFRSYCFTMQSRIINLTSNYSMTINTAISSIKMIFEQHPVEFESLLTIINMLYELAEVVIFNIGNIYDEYPEKLYNIGYGGYGEMQNSGAFYTFTNNIKQVIEPLIALQNIVLNSEAMNLNNVKSFKEKQKTISSLIERYISHNNPFTISPVTYEIDYKKNQTYITEIREILEKSEQEINYAMLIISERETAERHQKELEKKKRFELYWKEHSEQKLESEKENLQFELEELKNQSAPYDSKIDEIKKERDETIVPSRKEKNDIEDKIELLNAQQAKLGLFKGKEKKKLELQIYELKSHVKKLEDSIQLEEQEIREKCNTKIISIEETMKPIKEKMLIVQRRINEIEDELNMDR